MKSKRDEQGFAHLVIVGILVMVLIAGTGFIVYKRQQNKTTPTKTTDIKSECATNQELQLCVDVPTYTVGYTDSVKLQVTITNKTASTHTETFNSTCTSPYFMINNRLLPTQEVCGQAITPVIIEAKNSVKYTVTLHGTNLREGTNQVEVLWGKSRSPKITFIRPELNENDSAKSRQCNEGTAKPYCASLSVILKEGTYTDTSQCHDVEKYFEGLDIGPQASMCDHADYGILNFIVSQQEAQMWKEKLSAIPEVKSVTISNEKP